MLVVGFEAAAFGTNCYVLAPADGEECVVVDPGVGVERPLEEVLREHRLRPAAVLLTHGHLDHVYAVTPVCGGTLAAFVHGADAYRLADPYAQLGETLRGMLEQEFGPTPTWRAPDRLVDLAGGQRLTLAGLEVTVTHAPGHTEGSVLFSLPGVPQLAAGPDLARTVLSGDVLFAGSIGRTDLPGGDDAAMRTTLRDVVLPLPDDTLVLPGHGPATTIGRERSVNPFLTGLSARTADDAR